MPVDEGTLSFWGNIIGPIVGVIIGVIVTAIGYYFSSRRANRVVVERVSQTPQIKISKRISDNLEIHYKGVPVNDLVLNTLQVVNTGREIISPFEATLGVLFPEGEINYLEISINDPAEKTIMELLPPNQESTGQTYRITRNYINPIRAYKEDKINLTLFSNRKLDFFVKGGGKGWGVKYKDRKRADIYRDIVFGLGFMFLAFFINWVITIFDISLMSATGSLIVMILLISVLLVEYIQQKR